VGNGLLLHDGRHDHRRHDGAKDDPDHHHDIVLRAMRAKNGARFSRLCNGDINGHVSASEGDLALCSSLAFWTGGDAEVMDRLFRESWLYRRKWDTPHYGDGRTYGQVTIAKALAGASEFQDPKS
jgi:putative DNA primase/helicase